ncbi:hypothetical protein V6N11_001108 [Hibiscus sabdariffa]|uniref:K Homology domain-containing protein n=1 Tax=Hibiscus sabdariffa TaxID=183260 RepID=A0ABR2RZK4_9ROSI
MAQPGETPINPPMPPASQLQAQPPYRVLSQHPPQKDLLSTAKRRREEEDLTTVYDTGESASKRQAKAQDVVFRIVVPSKQIGKVIGKGGHRIQKIRDDTKATIKIADAIVRHEERVIIISSKDNENMVSDAENALQQIATLILKEDDGSTEAEKVGAGAGHVAANTIRLLIAGSQAGCLIGMSGQNIENLRASSGASITVLAPNQLPLCASAHESDRVVQISGDFPAVLKALAELGYQLRENPPRQVISISPAYNFNLLRPAPPQPFVDPTSGQPLLQLIMIRIESGATIKVYGGKGEQNVRHIQFSGSTQQVALAKQRVDECIYSQMIQQAGTLPPGLQINEISFPCDMHMPQKPQTYIYFAVLKRLAHDIDHLVIPTGDYLFADICQAVDFVHGCLPGFSFLCFVVPMLTLSNSLNIGRCRLPCSLDEYNGLPDLHDGKENPFLPTKHDTGFLDDGSVVVVTESDLDG